MGVEAGDPRQSHARGNDDSTPSSLSQFTEPLSSSHTPHYTRILSLTSPFLPLCTTVFEVWELLVSWSRAMELTDRLCVF